MPLYTGNKDSVEEFLGMFTNPKRPDEWSSKPYTSEQKKEVANHKTYWQIWNHCARNSSTFREMYHQIKNKTCTMNKRQRDYLVGMFEDPTHERYFNENEN